MVGLEGPSAQLWEASWSPQEQGEELQKADRP